MLLIDVWIKLGSPRITRQALLATFNYYSDLFSLNFALIVNLLKVLISTRQVDTRVF